MIAIVFIVLSSTQLCAEVSNTLCFMNTNKKRSGGVNSGDLVANVASHNFLSRILDTNDAKWHTIQAWHEELHLMARDPSVGTFVLLTGYEFPNYVITITTNCFISTLVK